MPGVTLPGAPKMVGKSAGGGAQPAEESNIRRSKIWNLLYSVNLLQNSPCFLENGSISMILCFFTRF